MIPQQGACEPIRALNRMPLHECGEPLVDIRTHCPGARVGRKCLPFLRLTVAEMLNRAQASFPSGYRLRVTTALRTLDMQQALYDAYFQQLRERHPEWSHASLRRATNRFLAPADQKAPPGHTTGGAVDVQLLSAGGRLLDLISPYEGWAAAPTWIEGLTARARRNRMLIVEAMLQAGFSNCKDEYWHYSFGDAAWAVRTGASFCFYGLALPPVKQEPLDNDQATEARSSPRRSPGARA
jgi:D-alanyl-D-alanine dipeptidase